MGRPISKLTIEGYKSIRKLDGFELRPLNILIGANGAGKSNFVSFFTFLRELVEERLQVAVQTRGGADALLYLGPKITSQIVGKLSFPPNSYEFVLVPTADNRLVVRQEARGYRERLVALPTYRGGAEARLKDRKDKPGKYWTRKGVAGYVYDAVSSWVVYHFHDTSGTAGVRRKVTVRDNEYLRADACNLAAFLLWLRSTHAQRYELIRDTIRMVAPFFDDFRLRPQPSGDDEAVLLEWSQKNSDYPFHPSQISDGTLRFMCLATALLQPRPPATILIDEPELGMHPHALSILAGLLKQAAATTQVIVSTQSAPLVDCFEPADVIVVNRKEGASEFQRLDPASLSEWLSMYTLGELWEKNVVEGGPAHE
jgi:predicted ATPase